MALALGLDLRREAYKLDANPLLASGDISGYGGSFSSINARRDVLGAFAEVGAPLTKALRLDAALRADVYGATSERPAADNLSNSSADRSITSRQSASAPASSMAAGST